MGLSIQAVSGYVAKLQRLNRIVRVKAPGVRAPRCFTDPQAAQRWVDTHKAAAPKPAPKPRVSLEKSTAGAVLVKTPAAIRLAGDSVETERTRRTIDNVKRPNSRIEAAPSLPPDPRYPSFASMRPGIDPRTGKAWGAAA